MAADRPQRRRRERTWNTLARISEVRVRAAKARLSAEATALASLTQQAEWLGERRREYSAARDGASAMAVKRRAEFAEGLARAKDAVESRAQQQRAALLAARDAHLGALQAQNRYELLADLQRQALNRLSRIAEQKENDEVAAQGELRSAGR